MKWEDFKKRLKNETHQQEVEVDVDAIWNAIEPQVDELNKKKRRRRFFFFWMFFVGVLALGGSTYFIFSEKNENGFVENNNINTSEVIDNQLVKYENKANGLSGVEKENKKSNVITASEKPNSTKVVNEMNSNDNNKNTLNNFSKTSKKQQQTTVSNFPASKGVETKTIQWSKATALDVPKKETDSPFIFSEKDEDSKKQTFVSVLFLKNLNTLISFSKNKLSLQDEMNVFYFSSSDDEKTVKEEELKKRNRKGKAIQFSLGIYGGASSAKRNFSLKNEDVNELALALQIREKYESPLEAVHYGIDLGVQHESGWNFSVGVQTTTIAEKYEFREQLIEVDSIPGIVTLRINLDGDSIPIMGMMAETTVTDFNKKIYNTYRLIDLPILVGYHREFGKWSGGVEAGLLASFSLKAKGIIPNENFEDVKMEDVYQSKFRLGYHFGIALSRPVLGKFDISLSPSVRGYVSDFTKEDYGLSQKYLLIGGNVGLRYRF